MGYINLQDKELIENKTDGLKLRIFPNKKYPNSNHA